MEELVNIHEAKTHLSRLLLEVQEGKTIIIARANKPIAKLVPIELSVSKRKLGSAKGIIEVADDFNAPLPDEVQKLFE
jgi:prevent-host-death family protein